MSLSDRYRANRCAVQGCERDRLPDSALCADDLNADWRHELVRQDDGTFIRRRLFVARDYTGKIASHAA